MTNIEETFRTNRSIAPVSLGEAALKKLAMSQEVFEYQQCFRLKKTVTRLVDGDIGSQFSFLISRLENIKLHDARTRINIRLTPVIANINGNQTFAYRFRGYSIVPGTSVRM